MRSPEPSATRPSTDASASGPSGRIGRNHLLFLAFLLLVPVLAILREFPSDVSPWVLGWGLLASLVCHALYAWDKRRAQAGERRVPEKILHLWELLGGWPGAFLAQRRIRHKSSKLTYLLVFWLIVVIHQYTAIDSLLDWRLSRAAVSAVLPGQQPQPAASAP